MKNPWLSMLAGAVIGLLSYSFSSILVVVGPFIGAIVGVTVTLATRKQMPVPIVPWICSVHVLSYHLPFFLGMSAAALGLAPGSDELTVVPVAGVLGSLLFVAFGLALILRSRVSVILMAAALGYWLRELSLGPKYLTFAALYVAMTGYSIYLYRSGYFGGPAAEDVTEPYNHTVEDH
jgi:hypothetical protein